MMNLTKYDPFAVGFDRMWNMIEEMNTMSANALKTSYPPYNIKKTGKNTYVIEMAIAGFGKNDLEITIDGGNLVVKGNVVTQENTEEEALYKGIANRAFTREFKLADNVVINNAYLANGMLRLWLEYLLPESKEPKKIEIKDGDEPPQVEEKKFLTE